MNALILDGATGERMKPITNWMPKDLMRIDGKSLLERHIEALQKIEEIEKIAITVHQHKDKVLRAIKSLEKGNKPLIPYIEKKLRGTAEATIRTWEILGKDKPLMVIYGDVYFDEQEVEKMQFKHMIATYQGHEESMSFLGYGALKKPPTGVMTFALPSEQVESFIERPEKLEYPRDKIIRSHAGALILCPEIFPILQELKPNIGLYNLGEDLFPQAVKRKPFHAYEISFHSDVGTIEQYCDLQQRIYNEKLKLNLAPDLAPIFKALLEIQGIIWIIGNGGSLSVAQHAVLDFTKAAGRKSIPLSDSATLTAYSNDISFEDSFSSQLKGVWGKEDTLIALSTSGESLNILKAVDNANKEGVKTIGLTSKGSSLAKKAKIVLQFDERDPKVLEDLFSISMHLLTRLLEDVKP